MELSLTDVEQNRDGGAPGKSLFSAIREAAGLSHTSVAAIFDVRLNTAKSWSSGKRRPPPPIFEQMRAIVLRQHEAVIELAATHRGASLEVFSGLMVQSDEEAKRRGHMNAETYNCAVGRAWALSGYDALAAAR